MQKWVLYPWIVTWKWLIYPWKWLIYMRWGRVGGQGREEELGVGGGGGEMRSERDRMCAVGSLKEKNEKFSSSCQDSNMWPLDHEFGCLTTEPCSSPCVPCTTDLSLELCLRWCVAHNVSIYEVKKLLHFYCFSRIYCIGDQTSIFESPDYIWYWHRGLNYVQFIYVNLDPHFSFGAIVDNAWCMFLNSVYTCIHVCILRVFFLIFSSYPDQLHTCLQNKHWSLSCLTSWLHQNMSVCHL